VHAACGVKSTFLHNSGSSLLKCLSTKYISMKQTILFLLTCLLVADLNGQDLKITPAEVKQTFKVNISDPSLSLEVYSSIENLSTKDTLKLKWKRRELDRPSAWLTQVCDGVECFIPIVSSNIDPALGLNAPFILPPKAKVGFIFYVLPNQVAGNGKFAINFSSVSKPDSILTSMNFDVTVQNLTTNTNDLDFAANVQVFPNPASDYFNLSYTEGIEQIVVQNQIGVVVRVYLAESGQRYSLGGLPDGMYYLTLINQSRQKKVIKLVKRAQRP